MSLKHIKHSQHLDCSRPDNGIEAKYVDGLYYHLSTSPFEFQPGMSYCYDLGFKLASVNTLKGLTDVKQFLTGRASGVLFRGLCIQ